VRGPAARIPTGHRSQAIWKFVGFLRLLPCLQAYFDEWVFRFNRRRSRSRGLLFHRLMAQATSGEAIAYNDLRKAGRTRSAPPPRGAVSAAEPRPRPSRPALAIVLARPALRH